jgi:CHAT domain-containing protein
MPGSAQGQVVELVRRASELLAVAGPARAQAVEQAIAALEQALSLLDVRQRAARGIVLMNLGVAWRARRLGDPADNADRAVLLFEQALDLRDRQLEPAEWARVQNALGVALHERQPSRADDAQRARQALEEALRVRLQLGDHDEQAITLVNLANVESRLAGPGRRQHIEDAVAHYRQALELLHPENHETRAAVLLNLSFALLDRSAGERAANVEQAISALETALAAGLDERGRGSARLALANALGLRLTGSKADNLERAIELADAELERRRQQESLERQAAAANSLGILYGRRIRGGRADNLERAIALYRQALAVYGAERYPGDRAGALNNLATALRARHLGDRRANEQETVAALQEALSIYTRDADPYAWAGTMSNLGTALFERRTGDLAAHIDAAVDTYEQALEVRTESEHAWDWAATRFNLGQALWRRHHRDRDADLRAAAGALRDSLRMRTRERAPDEWAGTQSMLAVVLDELGERGADGALEAAEAAYRSALEIYTPERFPFEARANANNLAGLLLRERRPAEALEVARSGLRAAELLYLAAPTEDGREVEIDDNARLYRVAAESALLAGRSDAEVFALAEGGRGRLLGDWLSAGELPAPPTLAGPDLDRERELTRALREALARARELADSADRYDAVADAGLLREQLQQVWAALEAVPDGAAYVARRRGEPVSAAQLQEWLDAQPGPASLIALAPLRERPIAFVAASGGSGVEVVHLDVTHEQVAELVGRLRSEVVDLRGPLGAESWTALGEVLLAPALRRLPEELGLLYVVPYGSLHGVPWAACTVDGAALVERTALAYLPGVGAALRLPVVPASGPGVEAVVVGDPLGDLRGARAEAETVAAALGARALLGAEASREQVAARLPASNWAHFAAHGVYEPEDPMSSGVELADGRLTARQLLALGGTRRVVLSTCESGRQQVAVGEELWGLARALLYTGTATALLSLWRVDDRATDLLMRRFYAELAATPTPGSARVAEALRQAMLQARQRHPHSYLWAPFTLLGSPW